MGSWARRVMSVLAEMKNIINRNIINENEGVVQEAFKRRDYVQAFLLLHTLIESLLRAFLNEHKKDIKFSKLIMRYKDFLVANSYLQETFIKELTEFNRRRNRIIHQLWEKGYLSTNSKAKSAANAALNMYGLFIEFLETWDSNITERGFKNY
jgi:hypothetical protein